MRSLPLPPLPALEAVASSSSWDYLVADAGLYVQVLDSRICAQTFAVTTALTPFSPDVTWSRSSPILPAPPDLSRMAGRCR